MPKLNSANLEWGAGRYPLWVTNHSNPSPSQARVPAVVGASSWTQFCIEGLRITFQCLKSDQEGAEPPLIWYLITVQV
jgi:hypothetical protein